MESTKTRILKASLDLFSTNGYDGTSISDIASSVGICKSALYKHFKNKEEIFNLLYEDANEHYLESIKSKENTYFPNSLLEFKNMALGQINFTIHDEMIIKIRRLLVINQFKNENIKRAATIHFNESIFDLYTCVFEHMIDKGLLVNIEPSVLASYFVSPITLSIQLSDRENNTDDEMIKIEKHIDNFINIFKK